MKRLLLLTLVVCALLGCCFTVSAGSVPEDLLHSDDAQIFFAQVVDYRTDKDDAWVELLPVKVVKGDVPLGTVSVYDEPITIGDFSVQKNKVYLFSYFDEINPTRIYRVTDYDTNFLSLIGVDGDKGSMDGRFETYLNEGKYDAAEAERRARLKLGASAMQIAGELPALDRGERFLADAAIYGVGGATILLFGGLLVYVHVSSRRKKTTRPE